MPVSCIFCGTFIRIYSFVLIVIAGTDYCFTAFCTYKFSIHYILLNTVPAPSVSISFSSHINNSLHLIPQFIINNCFVSVIYNINFVITCICFSLCFSLHHMTYIYLILQNVFHIIIVPYCRNISDFTVICSVTELNRRFRLYIIKMIYYLGIRNLFCCHFINQSDKRCSFLINNKLISVIGRAKITVRHTPSCEIDCLEFSDVCRTNLLGYIL